MKIETGYTRRTRRVKSVQPDTFVPLAGAPQLRRRVPGAVEYEEVEEYIPYTAAEMIAQYKAALEKTDYAVIKIAEGAATAEEYADLIAQRQAWRAGINRLETEVAADG